jgi:HAMP domain-containing protein
MVTSLAMAPDPHDIMDELQVPDLGQPAANAANPHPGQSLTARALRSLPEGWHAVLWPGEPDEATPAQIAELLRLTDSGTAALSHRALDGLRAAYLRIYLDELSRPDCRPAARKLGGHVRCALSRRDTRLVSRHLGGCAQCGVIYADLVTMDAVLRGVIAPLILGGGTGPYPATAQPAATPSAAPLVPRLRRAGRGRRRAAVAAGAAVVLVAVTAVATMATLSSRPARNARHPAAAGSPAATPPAPPSGRAGSAGPSPSSAAIARLARPSRTPSPASSSRPRQGASEPPASTAPLPSASATLGSAPSPTPTSAPSPPCLVLPPLRLC